MTMIEIESLLNEMGYELITQRRADKLEFMRYEGEQPNSTTVAIGIYDNGYIHLEAYLDNDFTMQAGISNAGDVPNFKRAKLQKHIENLDAILRMYVRLHKALNLYSTGRDNDLL